MEQKKNKLRLKDGKYFPLEYQNKQTINYMRVYKPLFIILSISFFLACKNTLSEKEQNPLMVQGSINNQLTDQHIQIQGTRIFMIPPSGFKLDTLAMGFENEVGARIMIVDIIGGNFENNTIDLTENGLRANGLEPLKYNTFTLNGYPAKYAVAKAATSPNSIFFAFGDNTFCATISAIYPSMDDSFENEINKSLASIVYDKDIVVDPFAIATFKTDTLASKYRFSEFNMGNYYYALENSTELTSGGLKNTLFIKQIRMSDMIINETLTEESLSSFQSSGFEFSATVRLEYSEIDGYEAIETATFGTLNGEKNLLYTLTLINKSRNVGLIVNNLIDFNFEYNLLESKKLTHSIKFK